MNSSAKIIFKNNCFFVSGVLDFFTVMTVLESSALQMKNNSEDCFDLDLSEVTAVNSAAIALLIEWIKCAKKLKKKIIFKNIPSQLISIAEVAGVRKFF